MTNNVKTNPSLVTKKRASFKQQLNNLKQKYFMNTTRNNSLVIVMLFLLCVMFFLLVITINLYTGKITVSEQFKDSWMVAMQMFLTGFSLGISSYLLQRMTNNKLADTSIMGFGNFNLIPLSLLTVCTNLAMEPESQKMSVSTYNIVYPIVIIATSVLLCVIFNYLAKDKTKFNFKKLLLTGIVLNFVSIAIGFSIASTGDPKAHSVIENKVVGLIAAGPKEFNFYLSMSSIMLGFLWIMINSVKIKLVIQNQEIARQVGINNTGLMLQTMLAIGLLVGASYSLSGDFVFVGLMAGNIAFRLTKNSVGAGVSASGLIGSLMVLTTYFIFSNLINVPYRIIAPLIPLLISPYFIYLIVKWK